jgi:Na+/phosphate symporter
MKGIEDLLKHELAKSQNHTHPEASGMFAMAFAFAHIGDAINKLAEVIKDKNEWKVEIVNTNYSP